MLLYKYKHSLNIAYKCYTDTISVKFIVIFFFVKGKKKKSIGLAKNSKLS